MFNFKESLIVFTALGVFSQVFALSTSDMAGKTSNINNPYGNSSTLSIDMNKYAGNGAVAQIDWKNYNIPSNQTVKYGLSADNQTIVNRVIGANTSRIYGNIISGCSSGVSCGTAASTGKIFLINPAGVIFGSGAKVDLNSFTVSTKDIQGLKNLSSVKNLSDYQRTLKNNASTSVKFVNSSTNGTIWLDGADISAKKSVNILADNIVYKNSLLKTTQNGSKVQFVTADGVTFTYNNKGNTTYTSVGATSSKKTIYIDNSKLSSNKAAISSPNVNIVENSKSSNSYAYIGNSIIKGTKLTRDDNGNVVILGSNEVLVSNSKIAASGNTIIDSKNEAFTQASTIDSAGTTGIHGKDIYVNSTSLNGNNINVSATDRAYVYSNSKLYGMNTNVYGKNLAYTKNTQLTGLATLSVKSNGNTQILDNSSLLSANKTDISSKNQTYVKNASIYSNNDLNINSSYDNYVYNSSAVSNKGNTTLTGNRTYVSGSYLSAGKNANVGGNTIASVSNNSYINATNNVNLLSTRGNIVVDSSTVNAKNAFNTSAGNSMGIYNSRMNVGKSVYNVSGRGIYIKNTKLNNKTYNLSGQRSISYKVR